MRNRIVLVTACVIFAMGTVLVAAAQSKDVQITNGPKVENVTGNTATIAWSTNTSASTVLKYGTDRNNLNETSTMPWGGVTHRVTLKNLQPNTTYYYQVTSGQGQGTGSGSMSGIEQFQTSGGAAASNNSPGQTPATQASNNAQVLVGPIMQQVTDSSAQVYWETTQPTENIIKFGPSPSQLTATAQVPYSTSTHKIQLTNLQPNTTYYFAIQRPDGSPRSTGSFRTNASNAANNSNNVRIVDGPNIEYLDNGKAIVAWSTNVPSSSVVKYGQDPNALSQTAQAAWGGTTHRVTLNNLQPNTKYWFAIQSGQAQGTGTAASTGAYPFQTTQTGEAAMKMQH